MFIRIVESDDPFRWQPIDDESGQPYESTFQLRIVPDEVDKAIRKRHTRPTWEKKTRHMVDKLDDPAYLADVIDYAIVDWAGIKAAGTNAELACSTAMKARLPEKWKAEILRLCSGKEAGDVMAQGEREKKLSPTT